MSIELKIKAMSLAEEARIIRREECIAKDRGERGLYERLNWHRRYPVRREARHTHLARAYLKGVPYRAVERKAHEAPSIRKIADMVRRYGSQKLDVAQAAEEIPKQIKAWLKAAQ